MGHISANLGPFPPLTPDARPGDAPSTLAMTYELEFSDVAGLVTWRQTGTLREKIEFVLHMSGDGEPVAEPEYCYEEVDAARSEPEVIYGTGVAELRRPPGVLRRAAAAIGRGVGRGWRWVW